MEVVMQRRLFIATAGAALVAAATPASAKPIPIDALSDYFNAIETAEARFTQVNDDGTKSTGRLYIRRPGRARFEYDPPEQALVMAGANQVAIFDGRSNSAEPEQYPLKQTPLWLILESRVDLSGKDMVVGHFEAKGSTILALQDPDAPENGRIELVFRPGPVRLAGWVVVDGGGSRTQVVLGDLALGGDLPARLFSITQEMAARGR